MGPKCSVTGNPCDLLTSKCPPKEGECYASGPGQDMFESTEIIGNRLADGALVSASIVYLKKNYVYSFLLTSEAYK